MADLVATSYFVIQRTFSREIQTELIRKSIHILIALVPLLAMVLGSGPTLALLAGGVLFYTYTEVLRFRGKYIPLITRLTNAATRDRDRGKIVLGPITLGLGAMISLLLYPEPASVVAIYSLAFGDSISSIIGKAFGKTSLPLLDGKTLEGSLACFVVVFFLALRIMQSSEAALVIAAVATLFEAVPTKDLDNILMPMGSGFAASIFLI